MSYLKTARKAYLDAIKEEIKITEQVTEDLKLLDVYIKHPFFEFYMSMVDEYKRHEPKKGDSWRTIDISKLMDLLENISFDWSRDLENDGNLIDMANVQAMIYLRRRGIT